ncbi:MAG: WecB/TagA/CpsF family glycosyltransferase [Sporolactobacillus sp.]|nr:WecB/TagA/CpsF family glycosyltransferase [Sporolactobacillus sp.]
MNLYFLNDHEFNIAQRDEQYREILNWADYLLNDGIGIKLEAKVWGISLKQNLNGIDLIPMILKRCEADNIAVFLLGSSETAVRVAAHQIGRMYGHLRIAGFHHGIAARYAAANQRFRCGGINCRDGDAAPGKVYRYL